MKRKAIVTEVSRYHRIPIDKSADELEVTIRISGFDEDEYDFLMLAVNEELDVRIQETTEITIDVRVKQNTELNFASATEYIRQAIPDSIVRTTYDDEGEPTIVCTKCGEPVPAHPIPFGYLIQCGSCPQQYEFYDESRWFVI